MNLDDLMEVWRSQDASPLHGVNETLVRLALRQDEAKVQKQRRLENRIGFLSVAFLVGMLGCFLFIMIYPNDDDVLSGWDYAIPVVGVSAALLWGRWMYLRRRSQVVREQRFGESLRDQINRQIAQLDYQVSLAGVLKSTLLPMVGAMAMILASWRINDKPFNDARLLIPVGGMIFWFVLNVGAAFWWARRVMQRKALPRKRRLEALLKELEGQ